MLAEDPIRNSSDSWLKKNRALRGEWVDQMTAELAQSDQDDARIHPLQLALDVQQPLGAYDWLVIYGGNTHFWSEIELNMAGWGGQRLAEFRHPAASSMPGGGGG